MPSRSPVFLPAIRQDIQDIVSWTDEHFGEAATDRYAALIVQAFEDLQDDSQRPGAKPRPDLAPNAYVYHLAFSSGCVAGRRVNARRHFVLYGFAGVFVEFARLLHDSRDLNLHLPSGYDETE